MIRHIAAELLTIQESFPLPLFAAHSAEFGARIHSHSSMASQRDERTLKQSFASSLDVYQEFIQTALKELTDRGWPAGDLFGVEMAMEESISNAIRHGNKLAADKQVHVECRLSDDLFWLRVQDEGPGFRPDDVPDCRDPERLEVPGGRGVALILHYMTSVEYNDRGNCVTLEKVRSDDDGAIADGEDLS